MNIARSKLSNRSNSKLDNFEIYVPAPKGPMTTTHQIPKPVKDFIHVGIKREAVPHGNWV